MVSYTVGSGGLLIVEAKIFTLGVRELLDEETYRNFQIELARNPKKGAVIRDCGGLRKARVEEPQRGKGKRSGIRVIYLHIPEAERIDLLAIYSKDEKDDLDTKQRIALKRIAEMARSEALALNRKRKGI